MYGLSDGKTYTAGRHTYWLWKSWQTFLGVNLTRWLSLYGASRLHLHSTLVRFYRRICQCLWSLDDRKATFYGSECKTWNFYFIL